METPSSARRVTRSQASRKQQDRSALVDITNDSPIVGVAMESLKKNMSQDKHPNTPGSGEALLRGQVKTLLKVEEEAELSKLSLENPPLIRLQLGLANQTSQMVVSELFDGKKEENSMVTRSLLLDFSEKSDSCQGEKASAEDDDASIWSIQVNASTEDEDDEECLEEVEEDGDNDDYYEEGEEEEEDDDDEGLVDDLCEGLSKISVKGDGETAKFTGKHTRFVYNSDDELEGEEECGGGDSESSSGVLRLKGLPTPKGKHLRFPDEDEEEEDD